MFPTPRLLSPTPFTRSHPGCDPRCFIPALVLLLTVSTFASATPGSTTPCTTGRIHGPAPSARVGSSVVCDDTHFAVGVPGLDTVWIGTIDGSGGGSIFAVLTGPAGSRFGRAIATLDGEWFIGAPRELPAGTVHRYLLEPQPTLLEVLHPLLATPGARAGSALAAAGDLLVAGAPLHGTPSAPSGAAFCFRHTPSGWVALPPLFPPDGHREGGFGEAVATDGLHLAVGAPRAPGAEPESGSVAIFRLLPTNLCAPLALAIDPQGVNDDGFGAALAFGGGGFATGGGSGSDLAIGIPHRTPAGSLTPGGGVVHLVSGNGIASWPVPLPSAVPVLFADHTLSRAVPPGSPSISAAGFGGALVFGGDRLWVGSPADSSLAPLAGSITGFDRTGPAIDSWVEAETISSSVPAAGADFGRAIALSDSTLNPSDTALLVGLPGDPLGCGGAFGCDAGAFELFATTVGADCDQDGTPDPCAIYVDPSLDLDGDGRLDRCQFRRGDVDESGGLNLADPITWLVALASAGTIPIGGACPAAWNSNGDDSLDLADPIYLLSYLFSSGSAPPLPFPGCGTGPGAEPFLCSTECTP